MKEGEIKEVVDERKLGVVLKPASECSESISDPAHPENKPHHLFV